MSNYILGSDGKPVLEPVPTLQEVAKKRAGQTALVALGFDILIALAVLWLSVANSITSWEALWAMGLTVLKTVLTTIAQYLLRRFVDISGYNQDGTPKETVNLDAAYDRAVEAGEDPEPKPEL